MRAKKGGRHRKKMPGIMATAVIISGVVMFILVLMGAVVDYLNLLDTIYMELSLTLPTFQYSFDNGVETGNEVFETFTLMRYVAGGILGAVMVYAGITRVLETEMLGILKIGTSNKIIGNAMIFMVIILVFPPVWDTAATLMNDVALWLLNPNYSYDTKKPCPAEWYDDEYVILDKFNGSPYRAGWTEDVGVTETSMVVAESFCKPEFKVRYIFKQVISRTEITELDALYSTESDTFGELLDGLRTSAHEYFTNIFLGVAKAVMSLTLLLTAFLLGIMADVFISVLMAALPILLFLSLLPKIDKVVKDFLEALPILFFLPMLSATVLTVGAGFVTGLGVDCEYYNDCESIDAFDYTTDTATYVWMASLAVVFLAVSLPMLLVTMLAGPMKIAQQQVKSGVTTGAMVTGSMMARGAGGAMGGWSGGGKNGTLSKLGMAVSGGMRGLGQGMMSGGSQAGAEGISGSSAVPSSKTREKMTSGGSQEFNSMKRGPNQFSQFGKMMGQMGRGFSSFRLRGPPRHMPQDTKDDPKGRMYYSTDPARHARGSAIRMRGDYLGRTEQGGTPAPSGPSLPGGGPPNMTPGGQDVQQSGRSAISSMKNNIDRFNNRMDTRGQLISSIKEKLTSAILGR